MEKIKKVLRIFGLFILILLAMSGIGIVGTFLPSYRERYMDNEIRIEQVDKKKDDEDDQELKEVKN